MNNHAKGIFGEQLAVQWLHQKAFTIVVRNWRCGRSEIDLIATKNNVWHCIEVKLRTSRKYGLPETCIDEKKLRRMIHAANAFAQTLDEKAEMQVDVLSIECKENAVNFFLIENAG